MANRFFTWDDFVANFGREMRIAEDVYQDMVEKGRKEGILSRVDFTFVCDRKGPLEQLKAFLEAHYPYSVAGVEKAEEGFELNGETDEIAITEDHLLCWALDMSARGYEFDAEFGAYGMVTDPASAFFPDLGAEKEDFWFDLEIRQYKSGNRSGALISWSHVIAINPFNVDAWYSRAIVRGELHIWKVALRDYDEAIRLAPDFWSALVNRGALKDDHGDYPGAIEDYTRVIGDTDDDKQKAKAYFNRGNTKLNLKDKAGACEDWRAALALGSNSAAARIAENCAG